MIEWCHPLSYKASSEHFSLPLDPHTVCPFPCSKVRWVKCVRLFWPITVVSAHFLGTSKSKEKAKFVLAGSSQNQLTSSGNSPYRVCFLEFNLGQTARWAFYLFHQPGLRTWNHLGQPEMSTYWSRYGRHLAWKAKHWQLHNTAQKNNDDLDLRTVGKPVLRGKSQCGSSVWSVRSVMGMDVCVRHGGLLTEEYCSCKW